MLFAAVVALALSGSLQAMPQMLPAVTVPVPIAESHEAQDQALPQNNVTVKPDEQEDVAANHAIQQMPEHFANAVETLQKEITVVAEPTVVTPESPAEPTVVTPETPAASAEQQPYATTLGEYTSSYSTRQTGRCTNIRLAAAAIAGVVLQPGESFSFNDVVGKRTAARGYQSAHIYSGGEVVNGLGGGICQVSSTLFNAALLADMQITDRTCHGLPVSYVPAGRDATVSWGAPDFKFKNPYAFPVRITAGYDSVRGTITCYICGPKTATPPKAKIIVSKSGNKYVTQRLSGDKVTYVTTSQYK